MYIHMHTILTYLRDSLTSMRKFAIHTMDYVDAATANVLSPNTLSVEDPRNMLRHIESKLPPMMHPPISSDNTLHFYHYLSMHVLIADRQFLLLYSLMFPYKTEHNSSKYMKFSVPVQHENLPAEYKVN